MVKLLIFNSIIYYLCAESTDTAQYRYWMMMMMIVVVVVVVVIQFNSFIYVLTQQPWAFYRVSTDTYNRNTGQHKDNTQKQHTKQKQEQKQVACTGKY
jgi:hypothetical protein